MNFGEKLKAERTKKGWSQEELAAKLYVSRQSVSKWENGQNYPSIEIILKISDLLDLSLDELMKSDQELTDKVIKDSKQLAHPRLKFLFDILFLLGAALLIIKLAVLGLNHFTSLHITLVGSKFFWNFAPLILMIVAGPVSDHLSKKYKQD